MRKKEQSTQMKTRSLVLKLWQEDMSGDLMRLRGEVRDPVKRETQYFGDWAELKAILESNLSADVYVERQSVQIRKK